jgi:NTP pyrophosphatase (non-canonical NTP hydrolase)
MFPELVKLHDYIGWSATRWVTPQLSASAEHLSDQMVMVLGLAGEAAEVAEVVDAWAEDGVPAWSAIQKELGDVLYYWARLCHEFGYRPSLPFMANQVPSAEQHIAPPLRESLRLVAATGSVTEVFKKYVRDGQLNREKFEAGMGNVLTAWLTTCRQAGFSFEDVLSANREKVDGRAARGTTRGSGNDR